MLKNREIKVHNLCEITEQVFQVGPKTKIIKVFHCPDTVTEIDDQCSEDVSVISKTASKSAFQRPQEDQNISIHTDDSDMEFVGEKKGHIEILS